MKQIIDLFAQELQLVHLFQVRPIDRGSWQTVGLASTRVQSRALFTNYQKAKDFFDQTCWLICLIKFLDGTTWQVASWLRSQEIKHENAVRLLVCLFVYFRRLSSTCALLVVYFFFFFLFDDQIKSEAEA